MNLDEIYEMAREKCPVILGALGHELFPWNAFKQFPHIIDKIEKSWDTTLLIPILDELILSDRDKRVGFPLEVISELVDMKFEVLKKSPDSGALFKAIAEAPADYVSRSNVTFNQKIKSNEPEPKKEFVAQSQNLLEGYIDSFAHLADLARNRAEGLPYRKDSRKLGEILFEQGVLDADTLAAAILESSKSKVTLGVYLFRRNLVKQSQLMRALCAQEGIPCVNINNIPVMKELLTRITPETCKSKGILPLAVFGNTMILSVSSPFSFTAKGSISIIAGKDLLIVYTPKDQIDKALDSFIKKPHETSAAVFQELTQKTDIKKDESDRLEKKDDLAPDEASVAGLVQRIIIDAIKSKASDIHIESFINKDKGLTCGVRFRVDGVLRPYSEYPSQFHDSIIARIKVISSMDMTEKRRSQDGKLAIKNDGKKVELRVVTLPVAGGKEAAVMRILAQAGGLSLDAMGLSKKDFERVLLAVLRPHGLVLACGPTGSGKTSLLHALIGVLNDGSKKIWTAEDPVEITQPGICQTQINAKIGWTFSAALRTFLRADPDVVMVGEMRDAETANMAAEAALTGHMVLSTLHSNSSCEAFTRLLDLGVDPFALNDAARCLISIRLIPKLCKCACERHLGPKEAENLAREWMAAQGETSPSSSRITSVIDSMTREYGQLVVREPVGCPECNGRGVSGRTAVFETLVPDEEFLRLVLAKESHQKLLSAACLAGMRTLKQDGIGKALSGLVSLSDVRASCS